MTLEETKKDAEKRVAAANPGCQDVRCGDVYENFMDGILVDVTFLNGAEKESINHVHYGQEVRLFRIFHDVCEAVSAHKEKRFFFRLLEFSGVGGLIAIILMAVFSLLLFVLVFFMPDARTSIFKIIETSFVMILGYFFGSQSKKPN